MLNKEIDSNNNGVPIHIGQIANNMTQWEGHISDGLNLTLADVAYIKAKYPLNLVMQS